METGLGKRSEHPRDPVTGTLGQKFVTALFHRAQSQLPKNYLSVITFDVELVTKGIPVRFRCRV
jgi:hypothetical protein